MSRASRPILDDGSRAPLRSPLTATQEYACLLVGLRLSYAEIGRELGVAPTTARTHVEQAAAKMPGDLPAYWRVLLWVRGADEAALTGTRFREALTTTTGTEPVPARDTTYTCSYGPEHASRARSSTLSPAVASSR